MVNKTRKFYRSGGMDLMSYSPPLSRDASPRLASPTRSSRRRPSSARPRRGSPSSTHRRRHSTVPSLSSADIAMINSMLMPVEAFADRSITRRHGAPWDYFFNNLNEEEFQNVLDSLSPRQKKQIYEIMKL